MSCNCGKSVVKKTTPRQISKRVMSSANANKRTASIKRVIRRPAK